MPMPMPNRKPDRNRWGFTIVELVVAIVIIGILAATALPRFVDLAGDAHSANVETMSSSFQSGVDLVHASWIANGAAASVNSVPVEGGGRIGVNDSGWPENTLAGGGDGTATAAECVDLWPGLMNSAPGVSATAGAADWLASVQGTKTCRYAYNAASGRYFDYDTRTGVITTSTGVPTPSAGVPTASPEALTPTSASPASSPSGTGAGGAGCGLVGIEPFLVLVLVRWRRALCRP